MKQIYPQYYNTFKCTASNCKDNCCIGWEIDIDENTLRSYTAQNGEFGKRLQENISLEDTPHFILRKDERCPFLNGKNLCDIFITLGEKALCEICTEHPRFHEWFGNTKESGLGLCCEAAAKLILQDEKPTTFLVTDIDEVEDEDFEEAELFQALSNLRDKMLEVLQNRQYTVGTRMAALLAMAEKVQDLMDNEDPVLNILKFVAAVDLEAVLRETQVYLGGAADLEQKESGFNEVIRFLKVLEPIDEAWPKRLCDLQAGLGEIVKKHDGFLAQYRERAYEYEHLSVYFLYRYMLKAVFDGDLLSRIKLMAVSVAIISLINVAAWMKTGVFSEEDSVENAKNYSKEIEYCEENLERFLEATWESEAFSTEGICALIAGM